MIYQSIVGSRCYGLEDIASDIDIAIIACEEEVIQDVSGATHPPFVHTPEIFKTLGLEILQRVGVTYSNYRGHPWVCQRFFPSKFCLDNELSQWIVENREQLIKAQLPEIYSAYTSLASQWAQKAHVRYVRRGMRKYIMYAIHFHNMMYNYAEGMSFAEAHMARDEMKNLLLSVRRYEAPVGLVVDEITKARERAKSVEKFYQEAKADCSVIDEFRSMVDKAAAEDRASRRALINDA